MLFDSRTLFALCSLWAARGELLLGKFFVRKVIFASLLCIMRQLYIVSYLNFRRGKCAVIYCFANGRATFTFTRTRDARSFLFHFKEYMRLLRSEYIPFDISHSYLTLPRKTRTVKFFHSGNTRLVPRSAIKHCRGGYEISIFSLLLLLRVCVVFRWQNDRPWKYIFAENNKGGKQKSISLEMSRIVI